MDIQSKTHYERYRLFILVVITGVFLGRLFLKPPFLESTMRASTTGNMFCEFN